MVVEGEGDRVGGAGRGSFPVTAPARTLIDCATVRFQGHYQAFQRDRAKADRLIAAGYVVLRFTWAQRTGRPVLVIATIARTLGRLEARAA